MSQSRIHQTRPVSSTVDDVDHRLHFPKAPSKHGHAGLLGVGRQQGLHHSNWSQALDRITRADQWGLGSTTQAFSPTPWRFRRIRGSHASANSCSTDWTEQGHQVANVTPVKPSDDPPEPGNTQDAVGKGADLLHAKSSNRGRIRFSALRPIANSTRSPVMPKRHLLLLFAPSPCDRNAARNRRATSPTPPTGIVTLTTVVATARPPATEPGTPVSLPLPPVLPSYAKFAARRTWTCATATRPMAKTPRPEALRHPDRRQGHAVPERARYGLRQRGQAPHPRQPAAGAPPPKQTACPARPAALTDDELDRRTKRPGAASSTNGQAPNLPGS